MKKYPVLVSGKKYSADFQVLSEYAKGWRSVLSKAHGDVAYCLCREFSPDLRKLSIRRHRKTDHYALARFSYTENEHEHDCVFAQTHAGKDVVPPLHTFENVVRKTSTGLAVTFHLSLSASKKTQVSRSVSAEYSGQVRKRIAPVKILAILQILWSEAGLDYWHHSFMGKRNFFTAFYYIKQKSEVLIVNKVMLSEILLLQTTKKQEQSSGRNKTIVESALKKERRLFVIAKLARRALGDYDYTWHLPIVGFEGIPMIEMSDVLWRRVERNQGSAYEQWCNGTDVVAIALIELVNERRAIAIEVGLMPIDENLVPIQQFM